MAWHGMATEFIYFICMTLLCFTYLTRLLTYFTRLLTLFTDLLTYFNYLLLALKLLVLVLVLVLVLCYSHLVLVSGELEGGKTSQKSRNGRTNY
ncbi:hypothetical protein QBC43DRAFT_319377 [Cladorrhinum sp. PSN259]|nr:hypothetical protein QBC43DRAFT_319377 [Cladorrhinum sp. PSN259]